MLDHYGARTSHRADQASKPVTVELLPHLGQNEAETFKNTFSQRALDKFGFIEAWARFSRPFGPKPAPKSPTQPPFAKIGVGTKECFAPPSEPDWQISCIRLSSWW